MTSLKTTVKEIKIKKEFKFLIYGVVVFIFSNVIYLTAQFFFSYKISFIFAFLSAAISSSILNIKHTFSSRLTHKKVFVYIAYYAAYTILNIYVITFLVEEIGVDKKFALPVLVVITAPIHYLVSKYLISFLGHTQNKF